MLILSYIQYVDERMLKLDARSNIYVADAVFIVFFKKKLFPSSTPLQSLHYLSCIKIEGHLIG